MTDYIPIDCAVHSEYELAIMRACPLRLAWLDEQGNRHEQQLLPLDLACRAHEEFLLVRDAHGKRFEIRLDRITHSELVK